MAAGRDHAPRRANEETAACAIEPDHLADRSVGLRISSRFIPRPAASTMGYAELARNVPSRLTTTCLSGRPGQRGAEQPTDRHGIRLGHGDLSWREPAKTTAAAWAMTVLKFFIERPLVRDSVNQIQRAARYCYARMTAA
jgi:hypothetical protein